MSRPGFVLEVDERTPPLLVHEGEGFRLQRFPLGTQVDLPAGLAAGRSATSTGAIRHALLHPHGLRAAPRAADARDAADHRVRRHLAARCRRCSTPDIRGRVIEQVLELAARAGRRRRRAHRGELAAPPDDARGDQARRRRARLPLVLPRRPRATTTPRTPTNLTHIGHDRPGRGRRDQPAGRRVRPARLREHQPRRDGRRPQVGPGRAWARYQSLRHHHNVHTMLHSRSFMDPPNSALHHSAARMGRLLGRARLKIFTIETTLNNDTFPEPFGFLNKREWEWSVKRPGQLPRRPSGPTTWRRRGSRRESSGRIDGAVRRHRHQRRRDRGRARADPRERAPPAAGRGERPVRRRWSSGCRTSARTT